MQAGLRRLRPRQASQRSATLHRVSRFLNRHISTVAASVQDEALKPHPRHALECELTPELPDASVRADLTSIYASSRAYAAQQATHGPAYFSRLLAVMDAVLAQPHLLEIGGGSAGAMRQFLDMRPKATAVALELSRTSLRNAVDAGERRLRGVAGTALSIAAVAALARMRSLLIMIGADSTSRRCRPTLNSLSLR